jgi:peroxiredoxin/uncharacterized membrane protein YphA (DoxX/SURF4 family)
MSIWLDIASIGLVSARLVLSLTFLVAAAAKLVDPAGGRQALANFGVGPRAAPVLAIALPLAELTVAIALIPVRLAWFGAVGALIMLLIFAVAISANLMLGRKPDCRCFGQLHSTPVGWSTLARNVVLTFAAGFLVWEGRVDPGPSVVSWFGDLTHSERVALLGSFLGVVLLLGQAALLVQILKQQGRILLRLEALDARANNDSATAIQVPAAIAGLPVGTPAPTFRLNGLDGKLTSLEDLRAAKASAESVLLLFTNPDCGPCQALLPEIGRWQLEHRAKLTIALLTEGTPADNRAKLPSVDHVLIQQKREVADVYQAWGTPAAVLIRRDGTIASPLAQGADAIRALVRQSVNRTPALVPTVELGDPAPQLAIADANGKTVTLADFLGRELLLVFWNPQCGFCQRMLGDLQDFDAIPPPGAPRLVVVSTGAVEDLLAMGLRSPVLLDRTGQAGAPFGATGTPMGILIDARGRIASKIAAGAQAVFELAGKRYDSEMASPELVKRPLKVGADKF